MQRSLRLLPRVHRLARCINTPASDSSKSTPRTASFGFRTVPEEEKESLVKNVFDSVASSYDLMNDASSLGVHRLWKDTFISTLRPGKKGPLRCIDVAGGTGDIALRILDHAREKYADRETTVEVVDINGQMLKEGFRRFKKTMYHNSHPSNIIHEANAQELTPTQFTDNTYDLYTIAFGIRNCTSIPDVPQRSAPRPETRRHVCVSRIQQVNNPLLKAYDQYSFTMIPLMGTILAGDRASYQYLVESIRKFPPQPEFANMIRDAGFTTGKHVDGGAWTDLWGGIACIHTAVKLA
ncbi:UbiE/COQ5 methyltransferase [Mycena olivaceomarginata]|nr:UbiE/COQ5 methyltransferase [Mycena olivaceomarginata]